MTLRTAQTIARTGLTPTLAAVASSDTFANPTDQRTFLQVLNGSASSINVTIPAKRTSQAVPGAGVIPIPDMVVAVAAGAEKFIGPFPEAYNDPETGLVTVNYSATATVTAAVLRLAGDAI